MMPICYPAFLKENYNRSSISIPLAFNIVPLYLLRSLEQTVASLEYTLRIPTR
jgi:hypothetical protein